jgi:lysophospholipase L1-like esterase
MKKWLFRISITFNVLVIALCLGAWLNRDLFIDAFLDQLYAAKVSFFGSFPLHSEDIVMLGDSITEGGEWSEMFPHLPIVNRGIPGDNTTGVLARLDSIVTGRPAAILIKIGTNDLTRGPERDVSYLQYRKIVTTIQAASEQTDIYVQSLLPRALKFRGDVEAYNREIRSISADLGVTYIDLYPAFLAPDGSIRDELTFDELHLNGEGYRLWQSLLEPTVAGYRRLP